MEYYPNVNLGLLVQLCVLNLPKMLLEIMPFALLFAGLLWTIKIRGFKELLIMRTTGISLFQICLPICAMAFLIGVVFILIFSLQLLFYYFSFYVYYFLIYFYV